MRRPRLASAPPPPRARARPGLRRLRLGTREPHPCGAQSGPCCLRSRVHCIPHAPAARCNPFDPPLIQKLPTRPPARPRAPTAHPIQTPSAARACPMLCSPRRPFVAPARPAPAQRLLLSKKRSSRRTRPAPAPQRRRRPRRPARARAHACARSARARPGRGAAGRPRVRSARRLQAPQKTRSGPGRRRRAPRRSLGAIRGGGARQASCVAFASLLCSVLLRTDEPRDAARRPRRRALTLSWRLRGRLWRPKGADARR